MKNARNYPGLLTFVLIGIALVINGVVDYINYELSGPSFLAAAGVFVGAVALIAVYEFKNYREQRALRLSKR